MYTHIRVDYIPYRRLYFCQYRKSLLFKKQRRLNILREDIELNMKAKKQIIVIHRPSI